MSDNEGKGSTDSTEVNDDNSGNITPNNYEKRTWLWQASQEKKRKFKKRQLSRRRVNQKSSVEKKKWERLLMEKNLREMKISDEEELSTNPDDLKDDNNSRISTNEYEETSQRGEISKRTSIIWMMMGCGQPAATMGESPSWRGIDAK